MSWTHVENCVIVLAYAAIVIAAPEWWKLATVIPLLLVGKD